MNRKCYIGSSVNLYRRNREHISKLISGKHKNLILLNAVKKYGIENFSFEILIQKCDIENLLKLEGYYVNLFKPEYNIDEIDLSGKRHCSNSTRKLIGEKSKQKFIDKPELIQNFLISIGNQSGWNKGMTGIYSEEALQKMSKAGFKNFQERKDFKEKFDAGRKKGQLKAKKKIIQYDLDMKPIKEWNSLTDAAKFYEAKSLGNFSTACQKGIKLFGSFWRLKE